jgi:rubrerythrin
MHALVTRVAWIPESSRDTSELGRGVFAQHRGAEAGDGLGGGFGAGGVCSVDDGEGLAGLDFVAERNLKLDTDRVVNEILYTAATAAESDDSEAEVAGVHAGNKSAYQGFHIPCDGGYGEVAVGVFEKIGRTAEAADHFGENLGSASAGEGRFEFGKGFAKRFGEAYASGKNPAALFARALAEKKNKRIANMDAHGVRRQDWVCEVCGSKFKWWSERSVKEHEATRKHTTKRPRDDNVSDK